MIRKPDMRFFFDNSVNKIAKNSIKNRLTETFKIINFKWLNVEFEKVRPLLKKSFFKYAKPD